MSELSVEAQQKLLQLKREYLSSFPEKINQLQTCWRALESKGFAVNDLNLLGTLLHKIAGSAGSYEMYAIHSAAHSAEQICKSVELEEMNSSSFVVDLKSSYDKLVSLMQESA